MSNATSLAAIAFYLGVAGLGVGAIRLARAAIERRGRDALGLGIVSFGAIAIGVAIALFVTGPREALPF
jgi:hypothetical protein